MATLVSTDIEQRTVDAKGADGMFTVEQMASIFPSGLIDIIKLGEDTYMVVDDNGYALGLPENPYGTHLYLRVGGMSRILGPVLLCNGREVGAP